MRHADTAAGRLRLLAAVVVAALLVASAFLPIWISKLVAPQYPKGLWLFAYGGRMEGDLREINGLNHYIGMRIISPEAVPELGLWPIALLGTGIFAMIGIFAPGRIGQLARLGLWLVPIGTLADIQRWLYVFGHSLDPEAALRLQPFTPLVVGPTKIWNFQVWAFPGPALVILVAVAVLVALTARLPFGARPSRRLVFGTAALALVLATAPAAPAAARAGSPSAFDLPAAIAAAPAHAVVHVPAGMYQGTYILARPITLLGDGHVMLDGGGRGSVLSIGAPDVTVRGLHITGSGGQVEQAAGIVVTGDRAIIEGNVIEDTYNGVLVRGARDVRITGNRISGRSERLGGAALEMDHATQPVGAAGDAVSLWNVGGILVQDNEILAGRDGIYLSYVDDALLDSNRIAHARYAIHTMFGADLKVFGNEIADNQAGLVLMYTGRVEAARNTITGQRDPATGYAVLAKDVVGFRLVENVIARNGVGIKAEGVDFGAAAADVTRNQIAHNAVGVDLSPSAALTFSRNSFVENLVQLRGGGPTRSAWTATGRGNYWSDYRGYDLDDDGVGDLPHAEGTSADRLLLAAPELELFRGSLAFRMLGQAGRWWDVSQRGTITDRIPLTTPLAPSVAEPARVPADAAGWGLLAGVLLAAAAGMLVLARPRA